MLLSGHGGFPAYLHRFGNLNSPACWYWNHATDDVYHSFFEFDAWESMRSRVNTLLGTTISPRSVVELMLQIRGSWSIVAMFVHEVLRKKEEEERRRQSAPPS